MPPAGLEAALSAGRNKKKKFKHVSFTTCAGYFLVYVVSVSCSIPVQLEQGPRALLCKT